MQTIKAQNPQFNIRNEVIQHLVAIQMGVPRSQNPRVRVHPTFYHHVQTPALRDFRVESFVHAFQSHNVQELGFGTFGNRCDEDSLRLYPFSFLHLLFISAFFFLSILISLSCFFSFLFSF